MSVDASSTRSELRTPWLRAQQIPYTRPQGARCGRLYCLWLRALKCTDIHIRASDHWFIYYTRWSTWRTTFVPFERWTKIEVVPYYVWCARSMFWVKFQKYNCTSLAVLLDTEHIGLAVGTLLLSCIRADIRVILCTSGEWLPSLISNIPRHGTIPRLVPACFLALKTC